MKQSKSQSGSAITEYVLALFLVAFSASFGIELFGNICHQRFDRIGMAIENLGGGTSTTTTEGQELEAVSSPSASLELIE